MGKVEDRCKECLAQLMLQFEEAVAAFKKRWEALSPGEKIRFPYAEMLGYEMAHVGFPISQEEITPLADMIIYLKDFSKKAKELIMTAYKQTVGITEEDLPVAA